MAHVVPISDPDSGFPSNDESEIRLTRLDAARARGVAADIRDAERSVVIHFHGFASACARRFASRGVDFADLVQIADVGLVKAARGWRPQPSGGFLQYAKPMIVGELKRYFRDQVPVIRLPRRLQEVGAAVAMARRDLSALGREPTEDEIAGTAGLTVAEVRADAVARAASDVESLEGTELRGFAQAVPDTAEATEIRLLVRDAIGTLDSRERDLLAMRFFHDFTQQQIGDVLGVSQMQVSRLLHRALGKLQDQLVA